MISVQFCTVGLISISDVSKFQALLLNQVLILLGNRYPARFEAGAGEEDQIQLCGFEWSDRPPGQAEFEFLMKQAAKVIDVWIGQRL